MKYPQSWRDACGTVNEEKLLDRLSEVGALREIPKPREWWICLNHWEAGESTFETEEAGYCVKGKPGYGCKFVKTREVIE